MHLLKELDVGALLMRVWLFQANPSTGDITPALIFGGAVTLSVAASSIVGAVVLRIMDNRFKERDAAREKAKEEEKAEREEADVDAKNQTKLIDALVVIGQAQRDNNTAQLAFNTAQAEERKELRTMLENRTEASAGRDSVKKGINEHTDEQVKLLREDFSKLQTTVNEATAKFTQGITAAELIEALKPIKTQLDNISHNAGDLLRQRAEASNGSAEPQSTPETPSS